MGTIIKARLRQIASIGNTWRRHRPILGSLFYANRGAEIDVNNRVKIAWSKWKETTGVMRDKNIPTKCKDNVYDTAIMV